MKLKNLLVCSSLILGVTLAISSEKSNAAEYTDALNAVGTGTITFDGDDDSLVPDPDDPDTPINPGPVNPAEADLKIVYVSDFSFGIHKKNISGLTAHAAGAVMADNTTRVPFITTKDMRVDRSTGWTLSCTASKFKSTDTTAHVIDGASVTLDGAKYTGNESNATGTAYPVVSGSKIVLTPETSVKVASADSTQGTSGNQGLGMYSLSLGSTTTDTQGSPVYGVDFILPANTPVNDATYNASFTWTLSPSL